MIVAQILRVDTERFSSPTCPPQTPFELDAIHHAKRDPAHLLTAANRRRTQFPELPRTGDTGIVFVASHLVVSSPPLLEDVTSVSA